MTVAGPNRITRGGGGGVHPLDAQMERASEALARCDYFTAERFCSTALDRAFRQADFERMSRIVLPLQEARRQIRQTAWDTGEQRGVALLEDQSQLEEVIAGEDGKPSEGGCYLLQPPLIGLDGRTLEDVFGTMGSCASVLTREPMTRKGLWPIVAVARKSLRVQIEPPPGVERVSGTMTGDRVSGPIPLSWFQSASEALGDAGIAQIDKTLHPVFQVEDLYEWVQAHPEHERLHQALGDAAARAAVEEPPTGPRPRPEDDLLSF